MAEVALLAGKYQTVRRLAAGGMGEVFLARETSRSGFSRMVVIKRMLPQYATDRVFVEMFLDEARIIGNLNHPNICQVLELGDDAGTPFLALEYVRGESLAGIWDRAQTTGHPIPRAVTLRMIADTAWALHFAHEARDSEGHVLNVVHRDISPHNVMVTFAGDVKLMDFGIARAENRQHRTDTGKIKGKISYMAPEQLHGTLTDRRADVFALGVMLWELTLDRRLFGGGNEVETLKKAAACIVPVPRTIDANYPPALEAIVLRALAERREQRTATAGELAQALVDQVAALGGCERGDVATIMRELFPTETATSESLPGRAHDTAIESWRPQAHEIGIRPTAPQPSAEAAWLGGSSLPGTGDEAPRILGPGLLAAARADFRPAEPVNAAPPTVAAAAPSADARPTAPLKVPKPTADRGQRRTVRGVGARPIAAVAEEPMPAGRRRRIWPWLLAATLAGGGVGAFAFIQRSSRDGAGAATTALQGGGVTVEPTDAGLQQADAPIVVTEATVTVDAAVAVAAADAGPVAPPRPTRQRPVGVEPTHVAAAGAGSGSASAGEVHAATPPAPGTLAVSSNARGLAIVSVDGVRYTSTPFQMPIAAGTHDVVLELAEAGGTLRARAVVQPGKKTKCRVDNEVLSCAVSP